LHEDFSIQVNHNPTDSAELNHGDVIQLGKHTLTYSEDAIEPAGELAPKTPSEEMEEELIENASAASKGILQIMNGDNFGRVIPLNRNMTRIGRVGGDCAMISRRDSGYYISHLEGLTSPMVNKKPIGDNSLQLNDGDVIEVGNTQMQFHI
jgi:pSer/pThr/pTyr-binding forkhead associated (FHA) protein